jgi:heme oxygenase-like protein
MMAMPLMTPEQFADHIDRKIEDLFCRVQESPVYRLVEHVDTDARLVGSLIKWYLLEVFSFAPHITEATFTAIGRFPKNRPDLMKPLIQHDLEEVDHGEMALRDFIQFGGNEQVARTRRISPASFAVGATCRMLAERENPFAYLGYMYLLEELTEVMLARSMKLLAAKGLPARASPFLDFHAKADVGHSNQLRGLIVRVVGDYPDAAEAIAYGFDCFALVFPMPIWETALRHARQELAAAGGASPPQVGA